MRPTDRHKLIPPRVPQNPEPVHSIPSFGTLPLRPTFPPPPPFSPSHRFCSFARRSPLATLRTTPRRNRAGEAELAELALPTRKQEPYRYTDLESLYRTDFTSAGADAAAAAATAAAVEPHLLESCKGRQMVFVNGVFNEELSDVSGLGGVEGLVAGHIGAMEGAPLDQVRTYAGRQQVFTPQFDCLMALTTFPSHVHVFGKGHVQGAGLARQWLICGVLRCTHHASSIQHPKAILPFITQCKDWMRQQRHGVDGSPPRAFPPPCRGCRCSVGES